MITKTIFGRGVLIVIVIRVPLRVPFKGSIGIL